MANNRLFTNWILHLGSSHSHNHSLILSKKHRYKLISLTLKKAIENNCTSEATNYTWHKHSLNPACNSTLLSMVTETTTKLSSSNSRSIKTRISWKNCKRNQANNTLSSMLKKPHMSLANPNMKTTTVTIDAKKVETAIIFMSHSIHLMDKSCLRDTLFTIRITIITIMRINIHSSQSAVYSRYSTMSDKINLHCRSLRYSKEYFKKQTLNLLSSRIRRFQTGQAADWTLEALLNVWKTRFQEISLARQTSAVCLRISLISSGKKIRWTFK